METQGIHHLALETDRPARLADFYEKVVGLAVQARHEDEQGLRSVWLDAGGVILMIERTRPDRTRGTGIAMIAFRTRPENRPLWRARLVAAGHPVEDETPHTLYFSDPEGNRVGVSSWPEPGREAEGDDEGRG